MMKGIFNDFLLMVQFFTRIPINKNLDCDKSNFGRGAVFLPVIGVLVGGVQWVVYFFLDKIFPPSIVAVFVMLVGIMITGGLHIDGLGDCCDGFFASKDKDRTIEIMKDSRIGTYGGVGIIFDLILKFSALTFLIQYQYAIAIFIAPIVGRFFTMFLSFIGKNAKSTGSGNIFIQNVHIGILGIGFLLTEAISLPLIGVEATTIFLAGGALLTWLFNQFCISKIQGLTGDALGANYELVEILLFLLYIAMNGK